MAEAIMTIEEHNNTSNSGSKKLKQKRVPQRGLGVAQLERIRLEEQQIKDEILPTKSIVKSQDSTFRALKSSTVLKNCDFRLNSSAPFVDNLSPKKGLESTKQVNVSEGYDDDDDHDCSTLCSEKFSSEKDHQDEKVYHHGVVIQSPIFALPQYQQPVCSSSMVNISSGISSSSVKNYQMEPPSNQSYPGYNYLPLWPEEVKRVGIKRPYPFPPEFPPVPTFHCKFPPRYDSPVCTANSESRTYLKREVPLKSRNVVRQKRALNGDFLTLAPPTAVGAVNQQHPQNIELFKFETLPFQEVPEESSTRSSLNRSVQQRVFRFFPPPNVQLGQPGNSHGEVGGKVDLNLKL
ncbi:uncharacterized protein LOC107025944 isoform X1 [Solanum pennellii]|uniref:Uncharacterized protein LOC107025944 isoform X1 n=1 Tax=Solanum pennellii TaxID=28526 RepID=A0ABM1H979_SOLPN|nr:uncharacterized protein LOC107025944 isoform X1 [Solanum pennellii]